MSRAGAAALLAFVASCADIATAPFPIVTLSGSVTTPNGAPVPYATVYFFPPPESRWPTIESTDLAVKAGIDGAFHLELPATTYRVTIRPPHGSGLPTAEIVAFRVGREKPRLDFRFTGTEVKGVVTGPTGEPVPNATVEFWSRDTYSSVTATFDGTRYAAYIPPGRYDISVSPPSWVMGLPAFFHGRVQIAADTTMDYSLSGHRVTGTVTDPGGSPMRGASIFFDGVGVESGALSDEQGRYELYAPPGDYDRYGFPPEEQRNVLPRHFARVTIAAPASVDFSFQGVRWSGVVRSGVSGATIAGAVVWIRNPSDYFQARSTCDGEGVYSLYAEPWRSYEIGVSAAGFEPIDEDLVTTGSDSTLDFALSPYPTAGRPLTVRRVSGRPPTPTLRAGRAAAE